MKNNIMIKGAIFSTNRKYRYVLWRKWDNKKPSVMFIGINPSSADEFKDDRTITRVIGFAKYHGFGGVYMLNIFPHISTDYNYCNKKKSIRNDGFIDHYAQKVKTVVFAWGNKNLDEEVVNSLINKFPKAKCLKKNRDGSPMHPLFIPAGTSLKKFRK